jgi:hypothetical protein
MSQRLALIGRILGYGVSALHLGQPEQLRLIFCRPVWFKFGNVREIPVVLPEVEAITYHIVVGDLKAHVGRINLDNAATGAIKQDANI